MSSKFLSSQNLSPCHNDRWCLKVSFLFMSGCKNESYTNYYCLKIVQLLVNSVRNASNFWLETFVFCSNVYQKPSLFTQKSAPIPFLNGSLGLLLVCLCDMEMNIIAKDFNVKSFLWSWKKNYWKNMNEKRKRGLMKNW